MLEIIGVGLFFIIFAGLVIYALVSKGKKETAKKVFSEPLNKDEKDMVYLESRVREKRGKV